MASCGVAMFTNTMLIDQVKKALDIFELKYPGALGLFIFDNAPSHRKKPDNSLSRMEADNPKCMTLCGTEEFKQ